MLLAIDTATARASIALHDGQTLRSECTWEAANRHTTTLAARITQMLEASEVTPADLTAVAVCIGPGSYTGVRIGTAFAKGLAVSRHLPLIGIHTLDILAAAQPPDARPLYTIFAAGRKRAGYARYHCHDGIWRTETEVAVATWEELIAQIDEPALFVGEIEAVDLLPHTQITLPSPAYHLRRAGFLADLAWARLRAGQTDDPTTLQPLYAR
ncbi:MAG TPA: tRNA (adenosine(37)-N6)-threonylcarbamoyltransferase complex dimerization subunit type 1 TsaB [Anaerolineae bacterium]|nr:tRNA (adenosine(37)-N6)-threonylcarbamoyltransferase complex dimerization subunit type 1 TsaB [Anaerolineae bacterium]HQI87524.1 tRNA (adenosine(37)-N6)-threonylcarbamoyltransferase complex dimerization subunit type 1 TsaB [Anaerolineae bacterium]